jgi:hypothetical protein
MKGRRKIILTGVVGLGSLLRLRAVPPSLADVDGVNFARALDRFDPLHQAPHLPGYPVYVFAAKLFRLFDLAEIWALVLPALVAFPIGALLFHAGLRRRFDDAPALGALIFVSFFPTAVLSGAWPGSDGFGFALLLGAIGLLLLERPLAAGILFGLLLGVRLSWWPLAISALLLVDRRKPFALGATAAAAIWSIALLFFAPLPDLIEGTLAFGHGHFAVWGLGREIGLIPRLLAAALLLGIAPLIDRRLALALVPYGLWIALGQNLENPRHFLPLLPIAAVALASIRVHALLRWSTATALIALSLVACFEQGTELPPAAAIARQLAARSPERLQVFAGESARVIEHVAPAVRVWRPASAEVLEREALAAERRGAEVLIISDAPGAPFRGSKELAIHARR